MKNTFRFYKTEFGKWFLDLPDWSGSIDDLEMVQGADTMLDKISGFTNECILEMSDEPFHGAEKLLLTEDLRDTVGGGNYVLECYQGEAVNHGIWLCDVVVDVFYKLPEAIYACPVKKKIDHSAV